MCVGGMCQCMSVSFDGGLPDGFDFDGGGFPDGFDFDVGIPDLDGGFPDGL